jgi:hypothetical protein
VFLCIICIYLQKNRHISNPLSGIHNTSLNNVLTLDEVIVRTFTSIWLLFSNDWNNVTLIDLKHYFIKCLSNKYLLFNYSDNEQCRARKSFRCLLVN